MIRYDEHARFQMQRRGIAEEWVEDTIRHSEAIEHDAATYRQSYFKCLPGRRVMLRVIVPQSDPDYVISAYFDRRRPCA